MSASVRTTARTRLASAHARALVGLCAALALAGCASAPENSVAPPELDGVEKAIRQQLDSAQSANAATHAALYRLYGERDDLPIWLDADTGRPHPVSGRFLDYLETIDDQGLSRRDYIGSTTWAALRTAGSRPAPALARQDIALSRAFIRLAHDIDHGRVTDQAIRSDWHHDLETADYAARLGRIVDNGDPARVLDDRQPKHARYRRLIDALARYRDIQATGGWPRIAAGPTLEPGMQDARVPALRERLRISGDASGDRSDDRIDDTAVAHRYAPRLVDAVRHFQRRHGLRADGRIGPDTLTALDMPVASRIHSIKLNLERWRWMPDDFDARYIAVNIPAFTLAAVEQGVTRLTMNVIVGGTYDNRATPVFSDRIRYLILRPFWNIPHHIAVDEIVPRARRDPTYMGRRGYQIVRAFGPSATPLKITPQHLDAVVAGRLQVRQTGGPGNALGLVKFMFPNRFAVYLHSTPAGHLFSRSQRDLSHGCVRVAEPVALAAFALADRDDWNTARIEWAMHHGRRQRVNLAAPLPIYMMYWTAFTNADGINFRRDLYGRDGRLEQALAALPNRAS